MHRLMLLGVLCLCAGLARAELVTRDVDYRVGDTTLRGYLAYDDASDETRPGVLVVPEWWGMNDYVRMRAEQLADMGYVALVADMYGDGRGTADPKQAAAWAKATQGETMRARVNAGLATLSSQPLVDREQLAAIGFCFGGSAVLELAYSGAAVNGVVSFHGGLPAPGANDLSRIKTRFLVLHGADDPNVKPETIQAFMKGMRAAKADWQMVYYGNAVHAFSNPDADQYRLPGIAYNEQAAEQAWSQMQSFFADIFAKY